MENMEEKTEKTEKTSENDALAGAAQRFKEELKKVVEANKKELRDSQKSAFDFLNSPEPIPSRGVFNLATGVGKTRMMAMITQAWLRAHPNEPNTKIVVVVPRNTLISQGHEEFNAYHTNHSAQHQESEQQQLDIGRFDMTHKEIDHQIIFTTYNSLAKLGDEIGRDNVGLLLLDEAHHATSDNRKATVQSFNKALHYGFTATPWYDSEKNTEDVIGPVIATINVSDAIQLGNLAEVKNILLISNFEVDLSGVRKNSNGDYNDEDLRKALVQATSSKNSTSGNEDSWEKVHEAIADTIAQFYHGYEDEYVGLIQGKKCLINCRSQKEAEIQADALNKLFNANKGDNKGDNKEVVVAKVYTSEHNDPATLKEFTTGKLPVLCQVGKLTEGFDMPELAITINYPTASYVREAQGAARCLRCPRDGSDKLGLVVDIVFRAPGIDNPVIGAHKNRQKLYQDVIGNSVIFRQNSSITSRNVRSFDGNKEPTETLSLGDFAVVCGVKELITITREAKESVIPSVDHKTLLSSGDLVKSGIFRNQDIALRYLRQAQADDKERTEPFVVEAKGDNGCPCLALRETKLKEFKDRYLSRPFVDHKKLLSSMDLVDKKIFGCPSAALPYLKKAQADDKEGTEPFVVEATGDNGCPCLALRETKLKEFIDKYLSRPSVDHEKLLSSRDLADKEIFGNQNTVIRYLNKAKAEYGESFVVEAKGDNGKPCLALRAEKLEDFKTYVKTLRQRNKEDQSPTPPIVVGKQGSTNSNVASRALNQQSQNSQG